MEKSILHTTEIKKTWETPTITEIDKSKILGDPGNSNEGQGLGAGATGGPTAS